ncbi:MAG TPA: class I SAM-dependent methyltransferase [Candidatus Koribacter sp.]|jgi:SAM-dependent methyltransferase
MSATGRGVFNKQSSRVKSSELSLQCLRCGGDLGQVPHSSARENDRLVCANCPLQIAATGGIWDALLPERARYFGQFIRDYEAIRSAEGRGSRNPGFYLSLPDRDLTGNNREQWAIRSKTFACLREELLPRFKQKLGSTMDVLDLGAGNGWLSYRLALLGHRPVAVDLLTNDFDGLAAAQHYHSRLPHLFPRFRAEMDRLPFHPGQFDLVIFNASFHYSENYSETLREALRCLRRPGVAVIADTPWYSHARHGRAMLAERREHFQRKHGTASDTIPAQEFVTDDCLHALEDEFGLRWQSVTPNYGLKWQLRPVIARLRRRREPSRFRIYFAEVER